MAYDVNMKIDTKEYENILLQYEEIRKEVKQCSKAFDACLHLNLSDGIFINKVAVNLAKYRMELNRALNSELDKALKEASREVKKYVNGIKGSDHFTIWRGW